MATILLVDDDPNILRPLRLPPHPAERQWDEFLRKPTPIGRLINVIRALLEGARSDASGQVRGG